MTTRAFLLRMLIPPGIDCRMCPRSAGTMRCLASVNARAPQLRLVPAARRSTLRPLLSKPLRPVSAAAPVPSRRLPAEDPIPLRRTSNITAPSSIPPMRMGCQKLLTFAIIMPLLMRAMNRRPSMAPRQGPNAAGEAHPSHHGRGYRLHLHALADQEYRVRITCRADYPREGGEDGRQDEGDDLHPRHRYPRVQGDLLAEAECSSIGGRASSAPSGR